MAGRDSRRSTAVIEKATVAPHARTRRCVSEHSTSAMLACWSCPTGAAMNHATASTTPNAASAGFGSAVRARTALMISGVAHHSSTLSMRGAENRATFSLSASQSACSSWMSGVGDHITQSISRTRPAVKAAAPSHAPPPVASRLKATTARMPVRPPVATAIGSVR